MASEPLSARVGLSGSVGVRGCLDLAVYRTTYLAPRTRRLILTALSRGERGRGQKRLAANPVAEVGRGARGFGSFGKAHRCVARRRCPSARPGYVAAGTSPARGFGSAPGWTSLQPGDLAITVGWGFEQTRTQASGAVSHAVMPGEGLIVQRVRRGDERMGLTPYQLELLGDQVVDVHLSDRVCWSGVPLAAWDFKIGGFQVLRKWLSYREARVLGRGLNFSETRHFTSMARRLAELSLLAHDLDVNYRRASGVVDQDPFPDLIAALAGGHRPGQIVH